MLIGSLFSGAGGLDLAVEAVLNGETAWHCEPLTITETKQGKTKTRRNPALDVLAARWPGVPNLGDITRIDWSAVPPIEVLCGGFPCQDISSAGKRAGMGAATRSGLWSYMRDAIDALRPSLVVIENVRNILNVAANRAVEPDPDDLGDNDTEPILRALGAVLGDLADIGFDAEWATVSAASVGAPHLRERVFVVAYPAGARRPRFDGRAVCEAARGGRQRESPGGPGCGAAADGTEYGGLGRVGAGPLDLDLLPSPAAARSGRNRSQSAGASIRPSLDSITDLLPTPVQRDYKGAARSRVSWENATKARGDGGASSLADVALLLLPTPNAADGARGQDYARADGDGSRGDDLITAAVKATNANAWRKYEPAIRRWEALLRPAPAPTEPNTKGNPRLAPPFSEWMIGYPAGWITDVPGVSRNDQLRLIGNSVCPQQATAAIRWLLTCLPVMEFAGGTA